MNKKKIFFWIKIIVIIYCALGIALYYFQDRFLFHPTVLPASHIFNFKEPHEEISIPVSKTDTISMIKFFSTGAQKKGLVIYYHGNRDNIAHYEPFVSPLTKRGYEVWMPDYPGFGKSTGIRTEIKLYELAWLIQKLAMTKYHSDSISIYGKSLGTGIAAYAASVSKSKQLILETPYYSIPALFNHWAFIYPASAMSNYKIPTWKFLEDVTVPVTIFHGTRDNTIPLKLAEKLKASLKPADQFITIPGGRHNDLTGKEIYRQVMDSLLR